jgi:hypothetical protein
VYRQHMRKRRGVRLAIAMAALCTLATAQTALAGTNTVRDPNDRPGPLDIRSVSHGHAGDRVKHVITTFRRWPTALLGPRTPNFFLLQISTDRASERFVLIFSSPRRVLARVFDSDGDFLGRADASRPNRRSVQVKLRRGLLGNPGGYLWRAFSYFEAPGRCGDGCRDRAPNGLRLVHDLRPPDVSFPQPPPPVSTSYNLDFTVGDEGESGLAFWRLEHRDPGGAWTTVEQRSTLGPQSVSFTADMSGDLDEFRVVAKDRHGNRTVSAVRQVVAPR